MDKPKDDSMWLEALLRRHLGRVSAPDDLWDRVVLPRIERPAAHHGPAFWILAASALTASVIAAAWGYYPRLVSLKELESIASARSSQENPQLEFQSDRPSDIQVWIRKRAGFDIPLLGRPNVSIQMIGANVIDPSTPIVEVRYKAAGQGFVLLASRAGFRSSAGLRHTDLNSTTLQNVRAVSWTMAGQSYTLASQGAEDWHAACLACHSASLL